DGRATNIRVVHALGMGLDEKAIDAVRRWKFKPAMQDGKPVAVQMAVEVAFRLYQGGITDPGPAVTAKIPSAWPQPPTLRLSPAPSSTSIWTPSSSRWTRSMTLH